MLRVAPQRAFNLPNVEGSGSDPYCRLVFNGEKKKTRVIKNDLNPTWNETFEWDLKGKPLGATAELSVVVKDHEKVGSNRLLGEATVFLQELLSAKNYCLTYDLPLLDSKKQLTGASVTLQVAYVPPAGVANKTSSGAHPGTDEVLEELEDSSNDEQEMNNEGGAGDVDQGVFQHPKPPTAGSARGRVPPHVAKKPVRALSSKPQNFQIRVRVVEGRQLPGNNVHPVVKVSVGRQMKRTRIRIGGSPFWNEIFFFNFNQSPATLFDEQIGFSVLNARSLRSDCEIGTFKLDIGVVYNEPKHAFIRKWVLLTDPDSMTSGPKGYLKVSLIVLGSGDEAPDDKSEGSDKDDVEKNLLRPAGVSLRGAFLTLRVYRAEDIPQMDDAVFNTMKRVFGFDSNKKNLVDPYVVIHFAGKKLRTKIVQKNACPEWNEALSLPIQFPSMCERLRITMYDRDQMSHDDVVGTAFLCMSKISCSGGGVQESVAGFLPTFGPCFINLYGSPREFTGFPDPYDELNMGKGEGVSYRGRVLVELCTKLEDSIEQKVETIDNDSLLRLERYLRRHRFHLFASFYTATMLTDVDDPIQFEVSIGNYGNKYDVTCQPLASTTQYTRAIFDGCAYYYLPWGNVKPVVTLTSYWENTLHRLEAQNILLYAHYRLERHLKEIRDAMSLPNQMDFVASLWSKAVDDVILDCSVPLPSLELVSNVTKLDLQRWQDRVQQLALLVQAAHQLNNTARTVEDTLQEMEDWLETLLMLATEPQNNIPDIVVWMLRGEKRVAYFRIRAHEILYSSLHPNASGRHCGKTRTILLKYPMNKSPEKIPAQLRVRMWFGLSSNSQKFNDFSEGKLAVFAETYENQMKLGLVGNWGTTGLTRPKFSDVTGSIKLIKERFVPPKKWTWDGDWFISPEQSMLLDADAGHTVFTDEVFENVMRLPGTQWPEGRESYTDISGQPLPPRTEIECPPDWLVEEDWTVDIKRAVDESGWEYGVIIPPDNRPHSWWPAEKMYHTNRRRRWVRTRRRDPQAMGTLPKVECLDQGAGWEYASLFGWRYHLTAKKTDAFRRRRWRRRLQPNKKTGAAAIFQLEGALVGEMDGDGDGDSKSSSNVLGVNAPTISCIFEEGFKYHLRCYVYQARDLMAMDKDSFSDPYAVVSFLHQSQKTETVRGTLNPTWDQSLIFHEVEIFGEPSTVCESPPFVMIEVFDQDSYGADEYLGRCMCQPTVFQTPEARVVPCLQWHPIMLAGRVSGELLSAFELIQFQKPFSCDVPALEVSPFISFGLQPPIFQLSGHDQMKEVDLPYLPPLLAPNLYMVPQGIKPVLHRMRIEMLAWGLRNLKSFKLASVTSPNVLLECGDKSISSAIIPNTKKNPNFKSPVLLLDVYMPDDPLYTPPLVIKVLDNRPFGRQPVVGQLTIYDLHDFMRDPEASRESLSALSKRPSSAHSSSSAGGDVMVDIDHGRPLLTSQVDDSFDWWSKFNASTEDSDKSSWYTREKLDTLKVYNCELEKVSAFGGLTDFCRTFLLQRGKAEGHEDDPEVVGEFKGSFRIYRLPDDPSLPFPPRVFQELPSSDLQECALRLYIISAFDLQPMDPNGLCDPYVKIFLGKKVINDSDNYIPNTLYPVFGRMYEMSFTLPLEKDLRIALFDYDVLSKDEKIGETIIDLENRFLSNHRAHCGLPQSYSVSGLNAWRDQTRPSQILEEICKQRNFNLPTYSDGRLCLEGHTFSFEGQERPAHLGSQQEQLSLMALHHCGLVPEHVETRRLYNPLQPGVEQGRLQMWVDLFPKKKGPPGPSVNITPRKPQRYQLRCIVWNTMDVILDDTSITGEKMSDIFVKGWLEGMKELKQQTDVHYRSLGGEGNFNWRFVFSFDYLPAEQLCMLSQKEHFWSLDATEQRVPPRLNLQIWDNDKFSFDDFLGSLVLDLHCLPRPTKTAAKCSLKNSHGMATDLCSLFKQKSMKGWWACTAEKNGVPELVGKLEMTLEILPEKEVENYPAGQGRKEPNMNPKLEEPKRPDVSFLWFTSPWRTLKYIVWRRFKWLFIGLIILILIVLFFLVFFYSFPEYLAMKIINPK
uniref:dysferlin isoform X2 n=1 Tax=Myxine glutinosa TaxID=7769 RepID=UPI00358F149C